MGFELDNQQFAQRSKAKPWQDAATYWGSMTAATADFSAPAVAINLDALHHNAHDLLRRAGGLPIRVASKSIRVREVLESLLRVEGFQGVLAYTLAEACWLAESIDDILVAYPTADRNALMKLATSDQIADRVTIMIDSPSQLDLIDSVLPASKRQTIRVALDFDASWWAPVLGNVGVLRSPIHEPSDLRALAEEVLSRPGFKLVGIMSYEAQIAGVGNETRGNQVMGRVMQKIQQRSALELQQRRAEAISLVRQVADLEFVNGGGTGSIESTVSETSITEVAAGSGLFGPHLFDNYAHFKPAPAVAFALDVVRKARPDNATALGGGWIASGVAGKDRLPRPVWPQNLEYSPREGAGEVQTPLLGGGAKDLQVGDRVWFRHTKSGEIMEHTNTAVLVSGDEALKETQTYRGEGKAFL